VFLGKGKLCLLLKIISLVDVEKEFYFSSVLPISLSVAF